jgi:hypothetical protein
MAFVESISGTEEQMYMIYSSNLTSRMHKQNYIIVS